MRTGLLSLTMFMLLAGAAHAETIKVSITGLVCSFCATGIEKTFKKEKAVDAITVDLSKKLVTIRTKLNEAMDDQKITSLIANAGYGVAGITREK